MTRARVALAIVFALIAGAGIGACDRVVDLTPAPDARGPDAANGGDDGGFGNDGGIGDAGVGDGGGALPDAFLPDA